MLLSGHGVAQRHIHTYERHSKGKHLGAITDGPMVSRQRRRKENESNPLKRSNQNHNASIDAAVIHKFGIPY